MRYPNIDIIERSVVHKEPRGEARRPSRDASSSRGVCLVLTRGNRVCLKVLSDQEALIYQNISLYRFGHGYQIYILPGIVLLMT